jgi:hypothetical protein
LELAHDGVRYAAKEAWVNLEQLFAEFQYNDLQWFIPVSSGVLIIVGSLLVALIRGMSAGVLLALFFGGLMSMSPVLLSTLQRTATATASAGTDVARSAAELAMLNSEVITDLSRVVATLRTGLESLGPVIAPPGETPANPGLVDRYNQTLADTEERLDSAIATLSRANLLRQRLDENINALDAEERRTR